MKVIDGINYMLRKLIFFGSMSQVLIVIFKYLGNVSYSWAMVLMPFIVVFGLLGLFLMAIGYMRLHELAIQSKIYEDQKELLEKLSEAVEIEHEKKTK